MRRFRKSRVLIIEFEQGDPKKKSEYRKTINSSQDWTRECDDSGKVEFLSFEQGDPCQKKKN